MIEPMVTGAVAEVIIGVKRDPVMGLALVLGSGGVLANLVADSTRLLLPTGRDEILRALGHLKVMRLVSGYRGAPAGDLSALLEAVMAIQAYALVEKERLLELDVNPVMVLPEGKGVVAVDALIRLTCGATEREQVA